MKQTRSLPSRTAAPAKSWPARMLVPALVLVTVARLLRGSRRRPALGVGDGFLRGLGLVYIIAFTSLRSQVLGLHGARGIVPVRPQLEAATASPSLRARP